MNPDTIVQIVTAVASAATAIVSAFIAYKTLKATHRSIDEANRPYVVVYVDTIFLGSPRSDYLIIKNFGQSGAVIDSLEISPSYEEYGVRPAFLNSLKNSFIAPNQSFTSSLTDEKRVGTTTFKIKYHDGNKTYEQSFSIDEMLFRNCAFVQKIPDENVSIQDSLFMCTGEHIRKNL